MIESVVNFQMILLLYLQIGSCAINLLVKEKSVCAFLLGLAVIS
jgi:hypothetical protein